MGTGDSYSQSGGRSKKRNKMEARKTQGIEKGEEKGTIGEGGG